MKSVALLDAALETGDSERSLARKLGMTTSALAVARHRGSLSPSSAATLAEHLGQDPAPWVALAALETAKRSQRAELTYKRLQARLEQWRKRSLSNPKNGTLSRRHVDPVPLRRVRKARTGADSTNKGRLCRRAH